MLLTINNGDLIMKSNKNLSIIKDELNSNYLKLNERFNKLENTPYNTQIACYFKEMIIQIKNIEFKDEWLSYYYIFGILYSLIDIAKTLTNKDKKIYSKIYDFNFDKYIKIEKLDIHKDRTLKSYFGNYETMITQLRCLLVAHPINNDNNKYYYGIDMIQCGNEAGSITSIFKGLHPEQNHILFKIQKYFKNDWKSEEDYNNNAKIKISNLFLKDYHSYVINFILDVVKDYKTQEEIDNEQVINDIESLKNGSNLNNKIGYIIKRKNKEVFASELEHIKNTFEYKFLKWLVKKDDSYDDIKNYIVNAYLLSLENNNEFDCCYCVKLGDKHSLNHDLYYWFEYCNPTDIINWKEEIYFADNYDNKTIELKNERFSYFVGNYLIELFDVDDAYIKEYFDKNIKPIKNFGDLFCFFIRKEISLVV